MIVMCYRNFPNGSNWVMDGASGWWNLATTFNVDGKLIDGGFSEYGSGVTVLGGLQNYSNVTGAIQHEIFHYLMHSNGTYGAHGSSGLMTGLGEMSYCMNPWERSLGYIGWTNTTNIETQGIYDFTLQDYIKGGEILKVVLPNTTGEEFYIVNSQRISMYDGIIRGGNDNWVTNKSQQDPYCPTGKGIYIYHHYPIFISPFEFCGTGTYEREFDIENAEGKYEWIKVRDVNYYVPGQNFTIPLFEPLTGNVISGKEETHHWIKLPNACMQKEVSDDPCKLSNDANDYIVTVDDVGDEKDAFNYGYDEIFSPYSNPSTHSVQDPNNVQPLTIKITGRNKTTGDISVRIYYDNESQALTDLPPSKPKNLKTAKHVINQQTLAFHPKLTWDSNREPDFNGESGEGLYRIYRGYLTSCDPDVEPEYSLLTSVAYNVSEYIDQSVTLYDPLPPGTLCPFRSYSYKIEAVDMNNDASLMSDRAIINGYLVSGICENYSPFQGGENKTKDNISIFNYPNPFNPSTQIKFNLPENSFVTIKIFNVIGQQIASLANEEFKMAGNHSVTFDGSNLASGIYYYMIKAGSFIDVKKMVLIK